MLGIGPPGGAEVPAEHQPPGLHQHLQPSQEGTRQGGCEGLIPS